MKNVFFIAILFVASYSHAQLFTADSVRPSKGDKQFVFALNNNSGFFAFKKYCSPKTALRFGFSGNYLTTNNENSNPILTTSRSGFDSLYYQKNENYTSNYSLNLFFGFQRSLGIYRNFEPYLGIDFILGNTMSVTSSKNNETRHYSQQHATIETKTERRSFNPTIGFLPFIGFNYYLTNRFALGAEYRVSVVSLTMNNQIKNETTYKFDDGTSLHLESPKEHESFNVHGTFIGTASITATMFLRHK